MASRVTWAAIVLASTGACGRLGYDDALPEIATTFTFASIPAPGGDVDLSATATPDGAAVVWVSVAGGELRGVKLGTDWRIAGDPGGTTVKGGGWLTSSAGFVEGALVTAELAGDLHGIKVDRRAPDLGGVNEFGCPKARLVTKPPLFYVGPDLVSPMTWDDGLTVRVFAGWSEQPSMLTVPSAPATGLAAAPVGGGLGIVWTTATECYFEHVTNKTTHVGSRSSTPCALPRVAGDASSLVLLFEGPEGVYIALGEGPTFAPAGASLLAPGASSPRIVHEKERFWVAYLDRDGRLTAGYLTPGGAVTVGTASTPARDAFELAIVDGGPWLIHLGAGGLVAEELVIPR